MTALDITRCPHGVDLTTQPRCYVCNPAPFHEHHFFSARDNYENPVIFCIRCGEVRPLRIPDGPA